MSIYRNNNEADGRYCVSPDCRIVFHEASQKTKEGWRECEESDIASFSDHLLIHAGRKEAPPAVVEAKSIAQLVKVRAAGTVANEPPE